MSEIADLLKRKANPDLAFLRLCVGCTIEQAQAVAEAVASFPASAVATVTVSTEIPLGPLLGRGPGLLAAMDLSQVFLDDRRSLWPEFFAADETLSQMLASYLKAQSFGPEDSAVLCVGLRGQPVSAPDKAANTSSASPLSAAACLRDISLPTTLSARFRSAGPTGAASSGDVGGGPAALKRLVSTIAGLPALERVNGVDLSALSAELAQASQQAQGTGGGGGAGGPPGPGRPGGPRHPPPRREAAGETTATRPIGASGGLRWLMPSRPPSSNGGGGAAMSLSSIQAINLTGCGFGAEGAEQMLLAAEAGGGGGLKALKRAFLADNQLGPQVKGLPPSKRAC